MEDNSNTNTISFLRLQNAWLRRVSQFWIATEISSRSYSWSTASTRVNSLLVFDEYLAEQGINDPLLASDPDVFQKNTMGYIRFVAARRSRSGATEGRLLSDSRQRQILITVEIFYRFATLNKTAFARLTHDPRWKRLGTLHSQIYYPGDLPSVRHHKLQNLALEDSVIERIANRSGLLAVPKSESSLEDLQAFHALLLLMKTGRRLNEILMLDFDPLEPLANGRKRNMKQAVAEDEFSARLRYKMTKVKSKYPPTIPVTEDVVQIVKAQQREAKRLMRQFGGLGKKPRYLFLRLTSNRKGEKPYAAATFKTRLEVLSEMLDIRDSQGNKVALTATHRFRHTRATTLVNAGVPLSVIMRYLGHASPEMTLHYARLKESYVEEEFLKYQKVTADGRVLHDSRIEVFDIMHLDRRADRVLPNDWCTLPPMKSCKKGNACLTCPQFVTDEKYVPELEAQLERTKTLIELRQEQFVKRFNEPMGGRIMCGCRSVTTR